jgi:uncharacterized repeat protein (TIGR03803 family)
MQKGENRRKRIHSTFIESLEQRKLFSALLTQIAIFKNDFLPGGLLKDAAGNLYGTTYNGGPTNSGQVFRLTVKSYAQWTLATFDDANGYGPYDSLIADARGNLFGTTTAGGPNEGGTVFELPAGSHTIKTLAAFNVAGGGPNGPLIFDPAGDLLGTTSGDGPDNDGTIFEITARNHRLKMLASFDYTNGEAPSGIVEDKAGNLYGTTYFGGATGTGTVFKLPAHRHTIQVLTSFNGDNGANAAGSLLIGRDGNIYGTTQDGGANGYGTIFKIIASNDAVTTIASFNGANGGDPFSGDLISDAAGNLYGTTTGGQGYDGNVFKLDIATNRIENVFTFNGNNGMSPYATLVADDEGNLYGTAQLFAGNGGEVFKITGSGFVVSR